MSNQEIPNEAVEAIARALTVEVYGVDMFDDMSERAQEILRGRGAFLLEAAAPHMRTEREKRFDVPTEPDDGLLESALGKDSPK